MTLLGGTKKLGCKRRHKRKKKRSNTIRNKRRNKRMNKKRNIKEQEMGHWNYNNLKQNDLN